MGQQNKAEQGNDIQGIFASLIYLYKEAEHSGNPELATILSSAVEAAHKWISAGTQPEDNPFKDENLFSMLHFLFRSMRLNADERRELIDMLDMIDSLDGRSGSVNWLYQRGDS